MRLVRSVYMPLILISCSAVLGVSAAAGQTPAPAPQRPAVVTCVDVALGPSGMLQGHVLNNQGLPLGMSPLVVVQAGQEIVRTATDQNGAFRVDGLRGGLYTVATNGASSNVRLWPERTAPPGAKQGLLLFQQNDVVLGQGAGGTFWRTVTNPWVSAGLIGAAIAVPIALNNNDSGS